MILCGFDAGLELEELVEFRLGAREMGDATYRVGAAGAPDGFGDNYGCGLIRGAGGLGIGRLCVGC